MLIIKLVRCEVQQKGDSESKSGENESDQDLAKHEHGGSPLVASLFTYCHQDCCNSCQPAASTPLIRTIAERRKESTHSEQLA